MSLESSDMSWVIPFSKKVIDARNYAFHRHDIYCNQWYDEKLKLRYSHHLQMVADVGIRFSYLIEDRSQIPRFLILLYCHDILEDGRLTVNDLIKIFGLEIALDIRKLSVDPRGITKEDRLSDSYYEDINTDFVVSLVKLCDRAANIEHGVMHGKIFASYYNSMDKINKHFVDPKLQDIKDYINYLLKSEPYEQFAES